MRLLGINTGKEVGRAVAIVRDIEDDFASRGKTVTKEEAEQELLSRWR